MARTRPMSHLDAALFGLETSTNHMNLGLLARFDAPAEPFDVEALLRRRIVENESKLEDLRLVVRQRLGGLATPVLVDGGPVDLDLHVGRVNLAGGDDEALDAWLGQCLSSSLDRRYPLWRVWVIEGLRDGGFAIFAKTNHGVFDGVAALRCCLSVFDSSSKAGSVVSASDGQSTDFGFRSAVGELVMWPARVVQTTVRLLRWCRMSAGMAPTPKMFSAPRSVLSVNIGPGRVVRRVELPLDSVRAIRRMAGATAIDVLIGVVSTALRKMLVASGKLPRRSMVAIVPAAQSSDEWPKGTNNRLAFWFVSMATDERSPQLRLRHISASSTDVKRRFRVRGGALWETYAGVLPPVMFHGLIKLAEWLKAGDRLPPLGSIIISSLTGPRRQLSFGGVPMVGLWPFGPPKDGGGINVTMLTYGGHVHVGLQGSDRLDEELQQLADGLPGALHELETSTSSGPS